MSADISLATAVAGSLLTNAGLYALVQSVMHFIERRRERKEDAEQRDKDTRELQDARRRDQELEDSREWYRESRENYKTAKDEAAEAKRDCAKCIDELRSTRQVIYRLLEDLEDQIIPMLMFDDAQPLDVRVAMRAAVQRARESL